MKPNSEESDLFVGRVAKMRDDVIVRQTKAMAETGLDAILSSSPEGFAYVTGFLSPTQQLMRWRHAMALVTRDASAALLIVDMEATTIRSRVPQTEIAVWREFKFEAMQVLADLLTKHGLTSARIGVELDYLPAADFAVLQRLLPRVRFEPVQAILARLRQIKTPKEIEILRTLSRIADQGISDSYEAVRAGMTEMDLAGILSRRMYELGADHFKLMIVATGERSIFPNVGPSHRALEVGDVCRVEIFPTLDGYHAGVCRTAYVEKPPAQAEQIWAKLTECKYLLLDAIKPGADTRAIYDLYLGKLRELDLQPISFIGHGIGLHLHEDPYLGPTESQPLEPGMVIAIEPLSLETGYGFGMQNKDMILVTDTGCELLSTHTNTDRLIRIA
jgi:Xaa-Pro dipeptidase